MTDRKLFDWRFVAAFCVMALVACAGYAFVQRVNQTNDLVAIAKSSERNANRTADDFAAFKAATAKRSAAAAHERALLLKQNRQLQHQFTLLAKFLRSKGFAVPKGAVIAPPRPSSSSHPKAQARPPASRGHRPGTPSPSGTPSPNPTCQLIPSLCDGLPLGLPTLLP